MPKDLHDLCFTCSHMSVCANRGTGKSRLFPCKDFLEDRRFLMASGQDGSGLGHEAQVSSGPFTGLCCDCENREGCCLTRASEGGVWHCEEYR